MRLVGAAERGMQLMVQRALGRRVFGKTIAEQGSFLSDLAKVGSMNLAQIMAIFAKCVSFLPPLLTEPGCPNQCRVELEGTRLLVLKAADQLDRLGNKKARGTIAMAKVNDREDPRPSETGSAISSA